MSDLKSSPSPQVKLVQEWGEGFQKKDLNLLGKDLHEDFCHITHPSSLNLPVETKEEWLARVGKVISRRMTTQFTTHSIIEAPGKVITHFTNETETDTGDKATYEAMVIAHIVTDDSGSLKIEKIEEFVDSKTYLEHMKALAAAQAKQE